MGSLIGEITSIADPIGRGRVRVRCKLIDQDNDLPCEPDGFIQTTELFTVNAGQGGSHQLLQVGTLVKVDPMYPANGRNWIVSGCVPNNVDTPHPDTNRAQGTHGSVSRNDVFHVSNDEDQSHIDAYPHGVVDHTSADGNRTIQTEEGARMALQQDGTATLENPQSYTTLTKEGKVELKSKGGAKQTLSETGEVSLDSGFAQGLRLNGLLATLHGPLSSVAAAVKTIEQMQGVLSQAKQALAAMGSISEEMGLPLETEELTGLLDEASGYLRQVQEVGQQIGQVNEALSEIQNMGAAELGGYLSEQIGVARDIAPLIQQVRPLLQEGLSGSDLTARLLKVIPQDIRKSIDLGRFEKLLTALDYDPELQLQAILDNVVPGGFEKIQNMVGMDLLERIPGIEAAIAQPWPETSDPEVFTQELQQRAQLLGLQMPQWASDLLSTDTLQGLIRSGLDGEVPTEELVGHLQKAAVTQMQSAVTGVEGALETTSSMQALVGAIQSGDESAIAAVTAQMPELSGIAPGDHQALAQAAMEGATGQTDKLKEASKWANQLGNSLPSGVPGANVMLSNVIGKLSDPTGTNSVYASSAGTGFMTPYGTFMLGALGGGMFSSGGMSILSKVGGLLMKKNGLSLSSLTGASMDEKGQASWGKENARILVQDDGIYLQSMGGGGSGSEIRITSEGIFVGDNPTPLEELLSFVTRPAGNAES